MKKIMLGLLLISGFMHLKPHLTEAQTSAGNDWVLQTINQDYWKFPVVNTGIYRIDSATLAQAGVLSLPGFDPRKIQLIRNGTEVPVFIQGEQDGVFNATDYIEFFGKKNDASADRRFFSDTTWQVNKSHSLFTDTAYYFLTVGPTLSNFRLIIETDVNYSSFLPAESYFWSKATFEPAGTYALGGLLGEDYSKDSRYMDGEGWVDFPFGIDLNMTNPRQLNLQTLGAYYQGPPSTLDYVIVGRSKYVFKNPAYPGKSHHVKVSIDGLSGALDDFTYYGYQVSRRSVQFPSTSLSTGFSTKFLFAAVDDMSTIPAQEPTRSDRNSIALVELTFPHGTSLGNVTEKWIYVADHPQKSKTYLSLTNLLVSLGSPILYDLTNNRRIVVTTSGNERQMLIPNSQAGNPSVKECYLASEALVIQVTKLNPLSTGNSFADYFADFQQNQYDYMIITHPSLMNSASMYAQYRATGGYPALYKPVLVDVEGLYEQFSFGIRNNPLAIENFVKFLHQNSVLPQNIFIIGKGYATIHSRRDSTTFRNSLVPGWGYPATDNMYINRLASTHINNIYIGRLAAATATEVDIYLEKVMQYEDTLRLKNEMWMKRAIHLGGGNNSAEQTYIKSALSRWESVFKGPAFGGHVTTFLKTSTEPIEILKSQQIKATINNGVILMSFFGHGSAIGFDLSTDDVHSYNNEGRYPLVIANSCYSGDLFNKTYTKSEEFVLTPKKGAIAYLGSSSYSTINVLNEINDTLYYHIADAGYGKHLGALVRSGLRPLTYSPTSFYHQVTYQQTTLHGDPVIVLTAQDKPDYRMSTEQIFFSPSNVTNEIDSFSIHIISRNAGKALSDSFAVTISRIFPDKSVSDTTFFYISTAFQDTFTVYLPVNRSKGIGLNFFEVTLDALYQIQESDETNNAAVASLYIKSSGLIPVYPYEFAVVPADTVTLHASTTDPFSGVKRYHFQIADNPQFQPLLATHTMQRSGGVLSWKPPVTLTDSMVYFWRVAVDSLDHPEGITDWRVSSFRYIDGRTGWAQAHFDQFRGNEYQKITFDTLTERFSFLPEHFELTAQTGIYPNLTANQHYFSIDGVYQHQGASIISNSLDGGFVFAVFDTITAQPLKAVNTSASWNGNWGQYQEPGTTKNAFEFPTHTSLWRDALKTFFDSVPQGSYVLGYSIKNHHAQLYPEALYQGFESIGSATIRSLQNNTPYVIFGRKGASVGDPANVVELSKPGATDTVKFIRILTANWNQGKIISTDIGPAINWQSAYWKQVPLQSDPTITDTITFTISAIDKGGNAHNFPALTDIKPQPDSLVMLGQLVDASLYPYLRFSVDMSDKVFTTPAQMKSWMVLYTPVGETAIDPSSGFTFHKDTIQLGDSVRFTIATRNISAWDMDSLLVHARVTDRERRVHYPSYKRFDVHPAGDTLMIHGIAFATGAMATGEATLWIEVNPVNPLTGHYDQSEQTHINNFGEKGFVVVGDNRSPLLDVTFDGIQILDGDIVSAQPDIDIQLTDENLFLLFNQPEDTAMFRVYLKYPGDNEFSQIHFLKDGVDQMYFYPSTGKQNSCRIHFPADFLGRDGTYMLRVEATDKSLGLSGSIRHQISFRVISKASITEVLNWPNPFSSRTRFVFTLTGYELPTDFRIQIMTVSGRIIRELTMDELGSINLGRNITDGYWDGTDEFGDKVANGVYLYRVITNIRGQSIDKISTDADRYFKEGWGKMYLMR